MSVGVSEGAIMIMDHPEARMEGRHVVSATPQKATSRGASTPTCKTAKKGLLVGARSRIVTATPFFTAHSEG